MASHKNPFQFMQTGLEKNFNFQEIFDQLSDLMEFDCKNFCIFFNLPIAAIVLEFGVDVQSPRP